MDLDRPGVLTEGEVTDAITQLTNDHRRVDDLFRRYEGLGPGDEDERGRLVDQMGDELSLHATIEETAFYPAVRELIAQGNELVAESLREHDTVKSILAELEDMEPTWGRFDATVSRLISTVRHHVNEEENEIFPKLRSAVGEPQLRELGRRLEQAKEEEAGAGVPVLSVEEEDISVSLFEPVVEVEIEAMPARAPSTRRPSPKRPTRRATGRKAPSAKKSTGRKSTRKKSTAKRASAKKSTGRKSTRKKSTAKRASAKKSTGRKSTRKKSTAKRKAPSAKKSTSTTSTRKKSTARKSSAKKRTTSRSRGRTRART
jgi:hemerythrin superfamily protein